jgi:hypothetical protein
MKPLPDINLLRELLSYNPESGELRWKVKRKRVSIGDLAGYTHANGYIMLKTMGSNWRAHRICWALHYGEDPELHIDHINGQRSDNRISNLRLVTSSENNLNTKLRCDNTSGHRGVRYNKLRDKWEARLSLNGKLLFLGNYNCVEEAINARLQAEADNNIYVRAS